MLRRVFGTTVAVELHISMYVHVRVSACARGSACVCVCAPTRVEVCMCLRACSLAFQICKAHEPCSVGFCDLFDSTTFSTLFLNITFFEKKVFKSKTCVLVFSTIHI
jgi:hypothetical protein